MADAARADELLARGGPLGCAPRAPRCSQGPRRHGGDSHDTRFAFLPRQRADAGRPYRDAYSRGRRSDASARPTPRNSAPGRRLSIPCSARRATRTTSPRRAAEAAAVPRWRWPVGWCRLPTAATPAARCETPRHSATWSGFRPSPGRVPSESGSWSPLSVSGPMARSVADVALFLSAIAGPDTRSSLSILEDGARFRAAIGRNIKGVRVAWWRGPRWNPVRAGDPPGRRREPQSVRGSRLRGRRGRAGLRWCR